MPYCLAGIHWAPTTHDFNFANLLCYGILRPHFYLPANMNIGANDAEQSEICASNLCRNCQNIFDLWTEVLNLNRASFPHCDNIFALEESASSGCPLCVVFLHSLHGCDLKDVRENATKTVIDELRSIPVEVLLNHINIDVEEQHDWQLSLNTRILRPIENQLPDNFDLTRRSVMVVPSSKPKGKALLKQPAKPCHNVLVESRYSLPPAFPESTKDVLPLAKQWLDECSISHSLCNVIHEPRTPSRLLSLSNNTIRLCLSEELPQCPKYATLSHCWGSLVLLNLKKSTIHTFRERVPSEAICKTFEHAIYITRYMGLEYLWIDSLCIIQDDNDDWIRESANMSSVYGGSSLNIAASCAPDGTFGCFVGRGPADIWKILVRAKVGDEDRFFECLPPEMYRRGLTKMPLLQRGWVVQERILAPRMLHFTSTQVFWECFENVACEVFPEGFPEQRADVEKYFRKKHFVEWMWPEVVELYSKCKLTYSSDKMVAISGLAQHIESQNNRDYVAGLWREGLESQLCWRRREPRKQRPPVYRAPTWSWASIDGGVRYLPVGGAEHFYIKILEVHTSPSGSNALGAISQASMRLECVLFPNATRDERKNLSLGKRNYIMQRFLDCMPETEITFSIMPILYHKKKNKEWAYGTVGLLLRPTGRSPGQYRREGIFWAESLDPNDVYDLARKRPAEIEQPEGYEDGQGNIKHVIELV
jgi:hypothetical protein